MFQNFCSGPKPCEKGVETKAVPSSASVRGVPQECRGDGQRRARRRLCLKQKGNTQSTKPNRSTAH
eukprot:5660321-Amphidinium_carterae.1